MLWSWNPRDPASTGWFLTLKRFMDPFALMFGVTGLSIFYRSSRGTVAQLRRRVFLIDMWASLTMLKRPTAIGVLSLIATIRTCLAVRFYVVQTGREQHRRSVDLR